jgi:hypothetical protein
VESIKQGLQDGLVKFAASCNRPVPAKDLVDGFWQDAREPFELLAAATDEPMLFTGVMVVIFYVKVAKAVAALPHDDLAAATSNQLETFTTEAKAYVNSFLYQAYDVKPWAQHLHKAYLEYAKQQANTVLKMARREPAPAPYDHQPPRQQGFGQASNPHPQQALTNFVSQKQLDKWSSLKICHRWGVALLKKPGFNKSCRGPPHCTWEHPDKLSPEQIVP